MILSTITLTMIASLPRVLFLVASVATLALPTATAAARSRQIHLRFYMHDITGGPGQTAVQLVQGAGPANPFIPGAHFGHTTVIDDALTEGPSAASRAVGRAQGSYVLAGLKDPVLMVSMTVALTAGAYNGSTIAVVGRDDVSAAVRELVVAGGTGAFRKATGHVLWRTVMLESRYHMVLGLDVYATVPPAVAIPGVLDGERDCYISAE